MGVVEQTPTTGKTADSAAGFYAIVMHPAFRLGFLDAQSGLPHNADQMLQRIERETPRSALERIGWLDLFRKHDEDLAQLRYEEGRLAHLQFGLKCRGWGHPDYPPAQVRNFIAQRVALLKPAPAASGSDQQ